MTRPGKIPSQAGLEPRIFHSRGGRLKPQGQRGGESHRPCQWVIRNEAHKPKSDHWQLLLGIVLAAPYKSCVGYSLTEGTEGWISSDSAVHTNINDKLGFTFYRTIMKTCDSWTKKSKCHVWSCLPTSQFLFIQQSIGQSGQKLCVESIQRIKKHTTTVRDLGSICDQHAPGLCS